MCDKKKIIKFIKKLSLKYSMLHFQLKHIRDFLILQLKLNEQSVKKISGYKYKNCVSEK